MRNRYQWAIRTVAVLAAGGMLVATAACGSSGAADEPAADAVERTPQPAEVDLSQLVTPAGPDHPAKGKVIEATFQEAMTGGLLAPPAGMGFTPDACVNFLDLGEDPMSLDGWLQYNEAAPVGKQHNLAHEDFFVGTLFELPGGVDMPAIRQAALTCDAGTVSLDGEGTTVTGTLVNTEVEPVDLPGATTFEMTQTLQFAPPEADTTRAVLEQYYGELDADGGVTRNKQIIAVAIGDIFYLVNMQDREAARQLATDFHRRAMDAGLG